MPRRPSLAILALVAGAFFLIGLYSTLQADSGEPPSGTDPTDAAIPARPTPSDGQTVILVIGVDDLEKDEPALRSLWYITFQPPPKDVFLLGVPVDLDTSAESGDGLRQAFGWSAQVGVSPGFLSLLYQAVPLQADALVVLDEVGFAAVVDYLGGIVLNGAPFDGQAVLGILSLTAEDPSANLDTQKRLLEAMSRQATLLGPTPEITPLVELVPTHLYLSTSINQMVMLVLPALPIEPETTHIQVY